MSTKQWGGMVDGNGYCLEAADAEAFYGGIEPIALVETI
jgi:hypothetical protein